MKNLKTIRFKIICVSLLVFSAFSIRLYSTQIGSNQKTGISNSDSTTNQIQVPNEISKRTDSIGNKKNQIIEEMPEYPGGAIKLLQFIENNLKYPKLAKKKGIEGKVKVRFVISSDGKIGKSEIVKSLDPECDREALRIVNLLPAFIPGKQNGVNVSVYYTLPISFKLE
ncbi:MAG: energy transducer TonB [Paludibacter sp.]|nr:energy transducer TonB [Paludibacter sp.]